MKAELVNGTVIGNYCVQLKLGENAEYVTYNGETLDTNQAVVLKAMRQPPALIRLALPDFLGRTTKFIGLQHENLCPVQAIERDEQAYYVICEPNRGISLREVLRQGHFSYQAALAITDQVLELLTYLHQQKVTCCDLRPDNLYLDKNGSIQLADAGLIQLLSLENQTTTPETISALEYTAPERILYSKVLGTKVDARADIYAVGILLYELLTGHPPLTAASREQMIRTQVETIAPPLNSIVTDVPASIEQIIFRALEKSPERRFATVETMRTALQRAQSPETSLTPLDPSPDLLRESLNLAAPVIEPITPEFASTEFTNKVEVADDPWHVPAFVERLDLESPAKATLIDELPFETPASEKVTVNDFSPAEMPVSPAVMALEIVAEPITVVSEPYDDHAFEELRAHVQPYRWRRKVMVAASALAISLLVGCSVYWMSRPAKRFISPAISAVTLPVTPQVQPSIDTASTPVPDQPAPSASTNIIALQPSLTTAPRMATESVDPRPAARTTPRSATLAESTKESVTQTENVKTVKTSKSTILIEKERRKRAILESLSQ